jgi:hypothetical protein
VLRHRRGDWFSIVATDLFCNILCAVIILDAVSPKEKLRDTFPSFIELMIDKSAGSNCAFDPRGVVLIFEDASHGRRDTLDKSPSLTEDNDKCRIRYFLTDLTAGGKPSDVHVVLTEYPNTPKISVRFNGQSAISCSGDSSECRINDDP